MFMKSNIACLRKASERLLAQVWAHGQFRAGTIRRGRRGLGLAGHEVPRGLAGWPIRGAPVFLWWLLVNAVVLGRQAPQLVDGVLD